MINGLSSDEANKRLITIGYNELPANKSKNIFETALEVIKEPMFLLLISCSALYIILGDTTEGFIMLGWVLVIIFITFYQFRKTEKALDALRVLSSPRAKVIRDSNEISIAGREVVPDDIVILNEGVRIAADGILLSSENLSVDESMLTGESIPVVKSSSIERNENSKVYSGTLVVNGSGIFTVSATGINTEFGRIGKSLQLIEQDQTKLQKEMKSLIRNLFVFGFGISIAVVAAYYYTRGNFLQSLLNGLAASMSILPEEFPVVLTVFLAIGSWRLSQQNILTRKPSAIETLGSATVLCSDKTGTITQNKMEVDSIYVDDMLLSKSMFIDHTHTLIRLIEMAFLASQKNTIDPMEKAIVNCYEAYSKEKNPERKFEKEYPLSKDFFAMTRVYKYESNRFVSYCKGAPETIFTLCKLNVEEKKVFLNIVQKFAQKGLRIIGVATEDMVNNTLPDSQADFNFKFAGLIGFQDPIRPEVPKAIQECYDAGIKVIMITGDYPETAKNIAIQAGMNVSEFMLTGKDLKNLNEKALMEKIKHVNIFARIIPEQKLQIIKALKANGEIVAMTGDGVNDAPALKAADIGIAMGQRGTDVAREASSLVLLDDNFSSIVSAIRLGRKVYDNLQKAMAYIIAIHIPIIGLTLIPAFFFNLPILLMPLHIVFLELIIDPITSIAFETEKEELNIMNRPPRKPNVKFFGVKNIFSSSLIGLLLLIMVLVVYFISIREGHNAAEIRAIAYSALIIGNIGLILTNLSRTRNIISIIMEKNIMLLIILISTTILLLLLLTIPYLRSIFSFEYPGTKHFIISIVGSFTLLFILEILKFFKWKNK